MTEPAVRIRLFGNNIRNPDLGVTCSKIGPADIDLPDPVLLIEVLSPGNKADTYENVRAYASIPSVREVILFASTRIEAQMLLRGADGAWPAEPTKVISGQRLTFSSLDLELPIEAAYEGTYLVEAQI